MNVHLHYAVAIALAFTVSLGGCSEGNSSAAGKAKAGAEALVFGKSELDGTRYTDGRLSEVRLLDYFEHYRDKAAAPDPRKIELQVVIVEWGQYDALVGDSNAAFGQLPNNTMVGGTVETNERVGPSSRAFFANARAAFAAQRDSLTRIEKAVPNRTVDNVSFDFVTNQGTFTVQEGLSALTKGTSPWAALYNEAKALKEEVKRANEMP
jgi:hypothetical protein